MYVLARDKARYNLVRGSAMDPMAGKMHADQCEQKDGDYESEQNQGSEYDQALAGKGSFQLNIKVPNMWRLGC